VKYLLDLSAVLEEYLLGLDLPLGVSIRLSVRGYLIRWRPFVLPLTISDDSLLQDLVRKRVLHQLLLLFVDLL
jgi:hypothetical protein